MAVTVGNTKDAEEKVRQSQLDLNIGFCVQAFTGLDDLETCGAILAQHDWNLEVCFSSYISQGCMWDAQNSGYLECLPGMPTEKYA